MYMKQIDNYCVLPFRGMQIWTDGTLKPCCVYNQDKHNGKLYSLDEFDNWWNQGLQELRNDIIDGNPPGGCSLCFYKNFQNSGVRVNSNNWMVNTIPDYSVTEFPENIDITFGNVCNLQCIMCSSQSSSKIETEYNQNKQKFNSIGIVQPTMPRLQKWWEDQQKIEKMEKILSKARYVNFSGGEPLMIPALTQLLELIPKSCFIELNTNLTHLSNQHLHFFNSITGRISVSLDGIGSHHEYVRYGSSWSVIENNIKKLLNLKNKHFEVAFSYILQHTSIYSFPKFWNYFKSLPNKIRISEVIPNTHKDNMMTINSVPPESVEKFKIWHKNNSTYYDGIIDTWLNNYQFDSAAYENFKEYITTLDKIRGCDFRATFDPLWS